VNIGSRERQGVSRKDRQQGITVISGLVILVGLGFVALIALRVTPIYIDYFTVRSTLEGLRKEPEIARMTTFDIHKTIQKRFDIGYVDIVKAKQTKVLRQGNERYLELVYEDRRPVIGNVDVVAKFNINIPLSP
jgi:hypothetical protein